MAGDMIETTEPTASIGNRTQRYQKLATTLRQWMSNDDAYDQRVWPVVEQALSNDGVQLRDINTR